MQVDSIRHKRVRRIYATITCQENNENKKCTIILPRQLDTSDGAIIITLCRVHYETSALCASNAGKSKRKSMCLPYKAAQSVVEGPFQHRRALVARRKPFPKESGFLPVPSSPAFQAPKACMPEKTLNKNYT